MTQTLLTPEIAPEVMEASPRRVFAPAVDIYETDAAYEVVADMPGVDSAGVEVTLDGEVLTIEGRTDAEAPAAGRLVYGEAATGDFRRRFTLDPATVDRERIEARIKNGVLRVTLSKAPAAQSRKIQVRAA